MSAATIDLTEAAEAPAVHLGRLRECGECGLIQRLPAMARGAVASCPRCNNVLRRRRGDPVGRPLALAITGLMMFALAASLPFMDLEISGRSRETELLTGPLQLGQQGLWELGAVVLATTMAAPFIRLCALVTVLIGVRRRPVPAVLPVLMRLVEWLRPWSMLEVFLLGALVAYTKLIDLATVDVGGALYALGALVVINAAADAAMDTDALWELMERKTTPPSDGEPGLLKVQLPRLHAASHLVGCDTCGLVCPMALTCPRCGASLRRRKTDSLRRTWALLIAAAIMYIPANVLPVLTVVQFGRGAPSTIVAGVLELAQAGMWPLALLVFVASITVPVLKLSGLSTLLIMTQRHSQRGLRQRTLIFRIVDAIGRWSMIDVFVVSILTALVRMGFLASVYPGLGALAFCTVVILTMLAAMSFDPRLMWDAAGQNEIGGGL